jgi:hypothetical protein
MRVFNITDSDTQALRAQGLSNQHLRIVDTVIPCGGSAELRGTAREKSEMRIYLKVRAITIDELPEDYAAMRGVRVDGSPLEPPEFEDEAPPPSSQIE